MFNFETNVKYDFIILDIPCSSVGIIRKNPEIFLKKWSSNKKFNKNSTEDVRKGINND